MPVFRVRVVASYPASGLEYPLFAIHDWAEEIERRDDPPVLGVEIAEDHQVSSARLKMTIVYEIDAPSERDARTDALSAFRNQSEALPLPESLEASVTETDEDVWERPY